MRKLGSTQEDVLLCLAEWNPAWGKTRQWYQGCGWVWDSPTGTIRILETFVKRGLVEKTLEGRRDVYTITSDGLLLSQQIKNRKKQEKEK